ncbi:MAG: hypothetical protein M3Q27_09130, partial [Actinomycetota bacterium]|nr:hypothetical protein [Actinomycetota bacterium]
PDAVDVSGALVGGRRAHGRRGELRRALGWRARRALEARLSEVGGLRVSLQQQARRELSSENVPVNR